MTTISATTILRSRHAQRHDKILSTLLLRYPRWIHAELMTHRVFSRNAASSRAIPFLKMIRSIIEDMAVPLYWGANQKGMQASVELTGWRRWLAELIWKATGFIVIVFAWLLYQTGVHKQIVNRMIEPWSHITVLVSSTEWSNFLALRDHPDAEPHIAILASEIRKELNREDNIQSLEPGQWHLPFANDEATWADITSRDHPWLMAATKKSVACCASTSYKTVDGFEMTIEKAIEIHDKLVGSTPIHASPAEHVAQAAIWYFNDKYWEDRNLHGNFEGFIQYRKMLPGESQ